MNHDKRMKEGWTEGSNTREGATDVGWKEGGRERGPRERSYYLQQEPAFPPPHAADPQRLMQRVSGVCGDGLEEGVEGDEEEAAAERTKKHHRQSRMMGWREERLMDRRRVVVAWFMCCLASLAPVGVRVRVCLSECTVAVVVWKEERRKCSQRFCRRTVVWLSILFPKLSSKHNYAATT